MPVNRNNYPENWEEISNYIRFTRANGKCEFCGLVHGDMFPGTWKRIVLTTAHLDHDTTNNNENNLAALCQRCHLAYDLEHHKQTAAFNRLQKQLDSGQLLLFPEQIGE